MDIRSGKLFAAIAALLVAIAVCFGASALVPQGAQAYAEDIAATSIEQLQSDHDYATRTDQTWVYTDTSAATHGMAVTFSPRTETESGYDFIYVYDGDDNLIGQYSGTELSNQTVYVPQSDTVKIRLTSDSSNNAYGFAVADIENLTSNDLSKSGSIAAIPAQSCADGAATPEVVVTYGTKTLVKGTDYTVSYVDNNTQGYATVTVKGTGDYTGKLTKQYYVYANAIELQKMTGYSIRSYNTVESGMAMNNGQTVEYTLNFPGTVSIYDEDAVNSAFSIDSRLTGYTAAVGEDGTSLVLTCHLSFALTNGVFTLGDATGTGQIAGVSVTTTDSEGATVANPATFDQFTTIIPSGLAISKASYTVGTDTTPASVTYEIASPSLVRGMQHIAWTSNGTSILDGSDSNMLGLGYSQTTTAHQHMFFSMDPATTIVSNAKSALAAKGYTLTLNSNYGLDDTYTRGVDPMSTFTLTADTAKAGEILDAYVYDDNFLQENGLSMDDAIAGLPYAIYPESDHNYANSADETYTYTLDGTNASAEDAANAAKYGLAVTFDSQTRTESRYDVIYIYDGDDNQIGQYSGTDLAGKTVYVPQSNTVKIRLTSDSSYNYYGFKVDAIEALTSNDISLIGSLSTISPVTLDAATPEPQVTYGSKTLVKGTDYTLSYENNTAAGNATVTVTGIGDYTGTLSESFFIYDSDDLADPVAISANQKVLLRQASDTGTTYASLASSDEAWANAVTGVTVVPVDAEGNAEGAAQTLTSDQYYISGQYLRFNRTADAPVFTVTPGEDPVTITSRWGSNTYPQSQQYQITVSATGYKDSVQTVTYYTGTSDTFSIIVDADGDSSTTDDQTVVKTWTKEELQNLDSYGFMNGSSQCGMTGFRTFSGYGVHLSDLLALAGVSVSENDSFLLDTSDHYGNTFTYDELFNTTRYFLQSIYDDQTVKDTYAELVQSDDEAGATIALRKLLAAKAVEEGSTVEPMISDRYVETMLGQDDVANAALPTPENTVFNTLVNSENQFRFFYGIELVRDDVTVTFDSNGGSEVAPQTVKSNLMTSTSNTTRKSSYWAHSLVIYRGAGQGSAAASTAADTIAVPENPTRDGYEFLGWYSDPECTQAFDFTANNGTVDTATTLYAKWGADKSALRAAIEASQADSDSVTETAENASDVLEGTVFVPPTAAKALTDAIDAAQAVVDDEDATVEDVAAAKTALYTAQANFDAAKQTGTKTVVDIADATIGAIADQAYTGAAIEPAVTVTYNGAELVKGTDYTVAYADNTARGTATVTITGEGAYTGTATTTFNITAQAMYRVYNPNSGEHFFTASASERDNVVKAGWTDEGIGWYAPAVSDTPVYRLYNENGGEHHYTSSSDERATLLAAGWIDEGIGWYSDTLKTVPLYRVHNPNAFANNHHFTSSSDECATLLAAGWEDEGIGWYGC